jgi:formylglycine-generating enzyme required for sulfatase activity
MPIRESTRAAGWLLRKWQQQGKVAEIDRSLASRRSQPPGGRQWYVNGQGQTLVVVPPGEFETGEGDKRFKVRVKHRFALAAREVTVAEFRRFRKDHQVNKPYTPTEDCPVNQVSWYDAAAYCNCLSKQEGIAEEQWCYEPKAKGEYAAGMKVKANALRLSGYRLPTEAEWEYACRAGSITSWSHGEAEDLLGRYAWFVRSSSGNSHPVASLRPNDLGLFDLHGNVWEWCQNLPGRRGLVGELDTANEPQNAEVVRDELGRVLLGGSFNHAPSWLRSGHRHPSASNRPPRYRGFVDGFRPARTVR